MGNGNLEQTKQPNTKETKMKMTPFRARKIAEYMNVKEGRKVASWIEDEDHWGEVVPYDSFDGKKMVNSWAGLFQEAVKNTNESVV